ncbi:MAG: DUF2795 domain-containing protein [Actinomycetota bacterium]|jgi:hypothetical protein|nr:DUF2795 domain-containing protein [Actinomycetota bacterium]
MPKLGLVVINLPGMRGRLSLGCVGAAGSGHPLVMGFQVTEVQKSLKGFDYPGTPQQLADHAEANGASSDLVEALSNLQKDSFDGPNAVMHSLSEDGVLGGSPG